MKRLLVAFFLVIAVALVAATAISSAPPDLIMHCLSIKAASVASLAIAAPSCSYRLNEWLALRKISRAEWYRTSPEDRPDTYGEGRMQRISDEADRRWLEKQERKARSARGVIRKQLTSGDAA